MCRSSAISSASASAFGRARRRDRAARRHGVRPRVAGARATSPCVAVVAVRRTRTHAPFGADRTQHAARAAVPGRRRTAHRSARDAHAPDAPSSLLLRPGRRRAAPRSTRPHAAAAVQHAARHARRRRARATHAARRRAPAAAGHRRRRVRVPGICRRCAAYAITPFDITQSPGNIRRLNRRHAHTQYAAAATSIAHNHRRRNSAAFATPPRTHAAHAATDNAHRAAVTVTADAAEPAAAANASRSFQLRRHRRRPAAVRHAAAAQPPQRHQQRRRHNAAQPPIQAVSTIAASINTCHAVHLSGR